MVAKGSLGRYTVSLVYDSSQRPVRFSAAAHTHTAVVLSRHIHTHSRMNSAPAMYLPARAHTLSATEAIGYAVLDFGGYFGGLLSGWRIHGWDSARRRMEILFLASVSHDFRNGGPSRSWGRYQENGRIRQHQGKQG